MTQRSFHFADVNKSKRLQDLRSVLMAADGPMTPNDIYETAKLIGITLSISAIPTSVSELGKNEGYQVSDGSEFGQEPGPAVKFPDKKYRYWLKSAPGWVQRWYVNSEFRVVYSSQNKVDESERGSTTEAREISHERVCLNCGKSISSDTPWCDDECNAAWKDKTFGSEYIGKTA